MTTQTVWPVEPHWLRRWSPHIRHVWQISPQCPRVSSFEVPTVRMDVDDGPSHSLVGALEQDLMSSPEERGFIGLWPDQDGESDGASVVSGEAPDVEVVETFDGWTGSIWRRFSPTRAVVMKTVPHF